MRFLWTLLSLLFCLLLLAGFSRAQSASAMGSISGVVLDPHGRPIPAAQLTIRNTDFALTREVTSDGEGRFAAGFLPAGPYTLQVRAPGFEMKKPLRMTVGAGGNVSVELRLTIKAARESVTVSGAAPTVEGNTTVSTAVNRQEPIVSNQVAGLTVTYLPNRDRDFTQLAQLAAGTEADPDQEGLVVAGQRPESLKLSVDGGDFNDGMSGGQRPTEDGTLFFPQTVVREFQLVHAGATADVGGTNAGFVNVVTKSGSNKPRGELFYIGRPSALTSSDPFGHSLDNVQNEFGGSIGGPLKKDHVFFYLGGEQDFLRLPFWTRFAPQAPGVVVPPALAAVQQQIKGESRPTAIFARTDIMASPANTLNLQVNYDRISTDNLNPGSTRTLAVAANQVAEHGSSVWTRGSLTSVLSPNAVNQFLVEWGSDRSGYLPNDTSPEIFVNGFGILGGNAFANRGMTSQRVNFADDISLQRGRSTLRWGGFVAYDPGREHFEPFLNGRYDFNSLADFMAGSVRRYRQTFLTGDATYDEAVSQVGAYFTWKYSLTNQITLNAGLRWEGQINPQPPVTLSASQQHIPSDLSQWQPRLGLAWSPTSKTVARVSAGLYDAATPATVFSRLFTDNTTNARTIDSYFDPALLALVSPSGLTALGAIPAGLNTQSSLVYGMAPGFQNPRSFQAAASVEQQFNSKLTMTAGYVRNSSWSLRRLYEANVSAPTIDATGMPIFPAARPVPSLGQILLDHADGHSTYDGLLLTATAQLPHRSQLTVNYTLSRSRDDGSSFDPFQPTPVLNPFQPSIESAYSDFDARHTLNISAVINLPLGFKANPILLARSGFPYTPIIGFDTQLDGNDLNDRAILNGHIAARNSLRQPAFANLDLRFVKDITLPGEGHHLDLFMDVFNITGSTNLNFGPAGLSYFGDAASPVASAGQALFSPSTARFGGPREVQFTVRLVAF